MLKTIMAALVLFLFSPASATPDPWGWDEVAHGAIAFSSPFAINDCLKACRVPKKTAAGIAITTTTALCAGKELYDYRLNGATSWKDITIDIIALTISSIIILRALP